MLLVHGWPQHWWEWRLVIGDLARTHRVICPDLRGFGWSDAPPGDYAKATLAGDLLGLLDALGVRRLPVIGHDWGGWIAFLLALRAPERVSGLLALSAPHPWYRTRRSPQAPLFASYQLLLSTPWAGERVLRHAPGFVERLIALGAARREHLGPAELARYSSVLRDPARAAASSALYRTFLTREAPRRGALGPLTVPASVVIGAEDAILRAVEVDPRPDVTVELVEGAGHFLPEEAPDAVLEHARRLLAR